MDPGGGFIAVGCGSVVVQQRCVLPGEWKNAFYSQPSAIHCVAYLCAELTEEIEGKGYLFQKEAHHCLVWKVELVEPLIATVPNVFEGESEGAIDLGVVNHLVHQRRPACHLMASNELSR
jgi:hypothetical protein